MELEAHLDAGRPDATGYADEAGLPLADPPAGNVQPDPDGVRRLRNGAADAERHKGTG
jgi:hypothetical protein